MQSAASRRREIKFKKLIITKRTDDFHVMLEGHPECWGHGNNIREAIGDMVSAHQNKLGLKIEWKKGDERTKRYWENH